MCFFSFINPIWDSQEFLGLWFDVFHYFWKIDDRVSFQIFLSLFFTLSSSWDPSSGLLCTSCSLSALLLTLFLVACQFQLFLLARSSNTSSAFGPF